MPTQGLERLGPTASIELLRLWLEGQFQLDLRDFRRLCRNVEEFLEQGRENATLLMESWSDLEDEDRSHEAG